MFLPFLARLSLPYDRFFAITAPEIHPDKNSLRCSIALAHLHIFMLYSSRIENSCQVRKNLEEGTMTQLEAASERPPHLKAIFPFEVSSDLYQTVWHNGLLNSTFINSWLSAIGVAAGHGAKLWRGKTLNAIRKVLAIPKVHQRFEYVNGEAVMVVLKSVMRSRYDKHPWDDLRYAVCVEHPLRDEFWDERNMLTWPWESMHIEALAWFDHWLKGAENGIDEGPPIRYWLEGAEEWPPRESSLHHFTLRADGTLSEVPMHTNPNFQRSSSGIPTRWMLIWIWLATSSWPST
jgi:hypothetical protein